MLSPAGVDVRTSVCLSAPVKAKMFKTFFSAFSAKEGSFKAMKGLARDLRGEACEGEAGPGLGEAALPGALVLRRKLRGANMAPGPWQIQEIGRAHV